MTHATPIECTVHWRASGQTGQRDLILRDRPLDQLIAGLVERFELSEHVIGPTQSMATLHAAPDLPPFSADLTLAGAGVRDGDHIWLVLTPTFLPVTVHWLADDRTGEHQALLPAAQSVADQIETLLGTLGLHELVSGPLQAIASLHPAPAAAALPIAPTLLDLDLHAGTQLWLNLTPRYMSVRLHWREGADELTKQRYLDIAKTVDEHCSDLVGLLGLEDQVNGPSRSRPALQTGPQKPALSGAQTLAAAGIRAGDALWFILTPTYVTLTVHDLTGDAHTSRQLVLPCTCPLAEVGAELARTLGHTGSSVVTLHPTAAARAWPAGSTLADHGLRDGDQVWLRRAPAMHQIPRAVTLGGGIVLALLIIVLAGLALNMGPNLLAAMQPTATGIASPPATPTALQPPATALPPTPTPVPQQDVSYIAGLQALAQAPPDYAVAAHAFAEALTRHPGSSLISASLSQTYLRWAESSLNTPCVADGPQALLAQALVHAPQDQQVRDLSQRLALYCAGLASSEQQDWPAAIASLAELHALQADFLDGAQRLYVAYMAQAVDLQRQNAVAGAGELCRQASTIGGIDTSAAQACAQDPRPRLRFVKHDESIDPACIALQITGVATSGWTLSVDGLRLQTAFDDAGNAILCGLRARREVTFSVRDATGQVVLGGGGVETRGSALMVATWP